MGFKSCDQGREKFQGSSLDFVWFDEEPPRDIYIDLLVFGGKLVAVRGYGLTILSMFGSPENFSVDITDTDCEQISQRTACVIGDKLYFYTSVGLKCFDGSKITAVNLKHRLDYTLSAVSYDGKYFAIGYVDVIKRDGIFCYDTVTGESCIIDESTSAIFLNNGIHIISDNGHKYIGAGNGRYSFKSSTLDFGTDKLKTVTEIKVSGKAEISISNGKFSRKFSIENGIVYPHMRGKKFQVTVEGSAAVKDVTVTAEVMDGVYDS